MGQTLSLKRCYKITNKGIQSVVRQNNIEYLDVSGNLSISDPAFKGMSPANRLKILILNQTSISIPTMRRLTKLPMLRSLHLFNMANPDFNDSCMQYVAEMRNLRELNIKDNDKISRLSLFFVEKLLQLKSISLFENMSGADIRRLANLRKIRKLDIANCRLKPSDYRYLAQFPGLQELTVGWSFSDKCIRFLNNCKSIRSIEFYGSILVPRQFSIDGLFDL